MDKVSHLFLRLYQNSTNESFFHLSSPSLAALNEALTFPFQFDAIFVSHQALPGGKDIQNKSLTNSVKEEKKLVLKIQSITQSNPHR
ncbi:hypothetical protein Prudu_008104 [Prunus dulcis]|uniref:Uncharacterized protein n=1 Tax=Prunus dulcis TaxID=3755 RepID=A0A4Y1R3I7_PRUDU|nr:hypothetical protein Prudu_008104 [Prunus dulcis]